MKSFRTALLAAILVLPVGALATSGKSMVAGKTAVVREVAAVPAGMPERSGSAYYCCWVYFVGTWMCIPC